MDLLAVLKRIASADPLVRRDQLLAILREMDAPFTHHPAVLVNTVPPGNGTFAKQPSDPKAHRPENVVVSFGAGTQRYVIGAHYDNVRGSTGANDNGAGVAILLALLEHYLEYPPCLPLDFVFFDLEEAGLVGSRAYIEQVGADNILGMINLDVCGVGDTVLAAAGDHAADSALLATLQQLEQAQKHAFKLAEYLPPGDDVAFDLVGIPSVSCAVLPQAEIDAVIELGRCIKLRVPPNGTPPILETMHNGPRDTVEIVEAAAMQQMLNFTLDLINSLQAKESAHG